MFNYSLDKCTGCGLCVAVCTKNAIIMKENDEGFYYPETLAEVCVNCGLCEKKCIAERNSINLKNKTPQITYGAISKKFALYMNGASAGAFATIASVFLSTNPGGIVCGATFGEDNSVIHIAIDSLSDLPKLQGSKYVQSELPKELFEQIKNRLVSGQKVLFSGTPCQVAAVKGYTKGCNRGLYMIDLICHGVPSPGLFRKEVTYLENKYGGNLREIRFRNKRENGKSRSTFRLSFQCGKKKVSIGSTHDAYYNLFALNKIFRKSCYSCSYANLDRVGDITIGDCDSAKEYSGFHPNEATNTLIINNERGQLLWGQSSSMFDCIDIDLIKESLVNRNLAEPSKYPEDREKIYKDFISLPMEEFQKKYSKPITYKTMIYEILRKLLKLA